jgi:AsmA protein
MRWVVRSVLGMVALAVLAFVGLLLVPAERIARIASDRIEEATGRAVTIAGDLRPTLWPALGVATGPVTLANAPWSDAGPLLRAEALSIQVDLLQLIGGDIRIKAVEAVAPEVLLEIASNGRGNWEMGGGAAEAGPAAPIAAFAVDMARLTRARVTLVDRAAGTRQVLEGLEARLSLPRFDGRATLELEAAMNGAPLALSAQVDNFAAFLGRGAVPVALQARLGEGVVAFDGRAGLVPLAAGGRLTADLPEVAALLRLLGQPEVALPEGLGRAAQLEAAVTLTGDGRVTLREAALRLDGNRIAGAADLLLGGERPKLTAQLTAGALDLSALAGAGEAAPEAEAPAGWSRAPIDVSGLQAVDAEIALAAESIDLGLARLGPTRLLTRLDAGRAVTEIREISAYEGRLAGSFVVNSRGGLSVRADLAGAGLDLQPLLRDLAGWDRLQTKGELRLSLLGVGDDMRTLMDSLEGSGEIRFGQGALHGLDLVGMIRNLDPSFTGSGRRTIFDSIAASFVVAGGVLRNEDLTFTSPLLKATGRGTLGLGAQEVDYTLTPLLLQGAEGTGLQVPVVFAGAWADPRIRLDLATLAAQGFGKDVEALRADLETGVAERLGAAPEEVLREELETQGGGLLGDLLGR